METSTIIAIIASIIGSGGISAILTALLSARKYKSEALKNEQEAAGMRVNNEITEMDYINQQLQKISEESRKDYIAMRQRNDELNTRINDLNDKLQTLMSWVVYDNQQYRQWLESKLHEFDPTIVFPRCDPPPKIFGIHPDVYPHNESDIENYQY